MTIIPRFNPLDPAVLADPYPHYARLRTEDPVHWGMADDAGLPGRWYITRFDDVTALLKDARFGREVHRVVPPAQNKDGAAGTTLHPSAEDGAADATLRAMADQWMILRDPPAHTRLRSVVLKAYTPRRVEALRPVIAATAHRLIDDMLAHDPPVDLLTHFALPFSVQIVAQILGLPLENYALLMPWSRALAAVIDLNQSKTSRAQSRLAVAELNGYLAQIIEERRRRPQDDLISALLHLEQTERALTNAELLGDITVLLFAGNDPVMHQIGNAVITLQRHPDQLALLRANPSLMSNAVEELLRFDSSVQATFRYALADVEWGGRAIRAGDHVAVMLASANRDPACCPDPDRLDIARPIGQVATFGAGIHYCLGAPLARIEGEIALAALLERLPNLALATDQLKWQPTVAVRGPVVLPVTF